MNCINIEPARHPPERKRALEFSGVEALYAIPSAKLDERELWLDGEVLPHDAGRLVRLPLSR
jgi:hypothetical protein